MACLVFVFKPQIAHAVTGIKYREDEM